MSHINGLKFGRRLLFAAPLALSIGCDSPDVYLPFAQFGGAAGVIDGTVTYSGPLPCTENQRIVGAALLLAFDVNLLPPPEGLGTSAASVAAVPGETLFSGIRSKLTFNPDGSRWCPPAPAPMMAPESVTVSGEWAISPLPPATYQIRGFYDLDGNFDPAFSISNLPTKGDVGGGAIDNPAEVLAGKPPRYREMTIAAATTGSRISGVSATLGLPLPLDRPIFYPKSVTDFAGVNKDPNNVVMASDFQFELFTAADLTESEKSMTVLTLGAGLPMSEAETAGAKPFYLATKNNFFYFSRQDTNLDGNFDGQDHIPEGPLASFLPLSIFAKIQDNSDLLAQATPAVIIQGLTLWKPLDQTPVVAFDPAFQIPQAEAINTELRVSLRPAALCLHVADIARPGLLVVTHKEDKAAHAVITNEKAVLAALEVQFGRPIEIAYGCIPEGRYAMNLVYSTGQAWTVPNEAGVCAPSEPLSADGTQCGSRAKLASQSPVLTVGPPGDPNYCASSPDAQKIHDACMAIK